MTSATSGLPLVRPARRGLIAVAVIGGLAVAVGLGVLYAGTHGPGRLDDLIDPALAVQEPTARRWLWLLVLLGDPSAAAIFVVLVVWRALVHRRPRIAVLAVAGPGIVAAGTAWLAQPAVGRTLDGGYSYPSGHTSIAASMAVVALVVVGTQQWPRRRPVRLALVLVLVAFPVAVAGALVALGLHYVTDTVGGACAAVGAVLAVATLVDVVAERRAGARPTASMRRGTS